MVLQTLRAPRNIRGTLHSFVETASYSLCRFCKSDREQGTKTVIMGDRDAENMHLKTGAYKYLVATGVDSGSLFEPHP